MFDIPRPVLITAAILAIAAGFGMLVAGWQATLPQERSMLAGGGTFLLVAGLLGAGVLWKTKSTSEDP